MKKRICLLTMLVLLISSVNCLAVPYELTRDTDNDGNAHYYKTFSDGSFEEITENEYYTEKYPNEGESDGETEETDSSPLPSSAVFIPDAGDETSEDVEDQKDEKKEEDTSETGDEQENDSDGDVSVGEKTENKEVPVTTQEEVDKLFSGMKETVVNSEEDVTYQNFLNTKKITTDEGFRYFVFLRGYHYAEITEDLYYLLTFKYERNTYDPEELNQKVLEEYTDTGKVVLKGFLNKDIEGYTIYLKLQKYFGDETFSYFVYGPDYEVTLDLPVGEYYIINGGLLNDYTYSYPITLKDFEIKKGEVTQSAFAVGDVTIGEVNGEKQEETVSENIVNDTHDVEPEPEPEEPARFIDTLLGKIIVFVVVPLIFGIVIVFVIIAIAKNVKSSKGRKRDFADDNMEETTFDVEGEWRPLEAPPEDEEDEELPEGFKEL